MKFKNFWTNTRKFWMEVGESFEFSDWLELTFELQFNLHSPKEKCKVIAAIILKTLVSSLNFEPSWANWNHYPMAELETIMWISRRKSHSNAMKSFQICLSIEVRANSWIDFQLCEWIHGMTSFERQWNLECSAAASWQLHLRARLSIANWHVLLKLKKPGWSCQ